MGLVMRTSLVLATLALAAGPARADRSTVMTLGATLDGRARGPTYGDAGSQDVHWLGGVQFALGFEEQPLAIPPSGYFVHDTRLVPELLAGFLADDIHAEGYIGGGLRGELVLASNKRDANMRTAMYLALRGIVIGSHQDPGAQLLVGTYLERGGRSTRFGWEGGIMMRPRPYDTPEHQRELDALISFYYGWR
jgi:hypothetical protein